MMEKEANVAVWMEGVEACLIESFNEEPVKDLTIRICRKEQVSIIGLGHSQKKAVFSILGCMEKPRKGVYIFDYEDVCLINESQLKALRNQKIGFMFMKELLLEDMTVAENLKLPLEAMRLDRKEKAYLFEQAVEKAGLEDILNKKTGKLQALDRRKTSFARAVINQPVMILADDPLYGLDEAAASQIIELMVKARQEGVAVISFMNSLGITGNAGRFLRFEGGKLIEDKYILDKEDALNGRMDE